MRKQNDPLFAILILLALIVAGCEVRNPASNDATFPFLFDLSAPDSVYLDAESPYAVHVKAEDPQGLTDIVSVELSILGASEEILSQTTMTDDGENGDIISSDGVFWSLLDPADFSGSGRFEIRVIAMDVAGHQSDPVQDSIYVVRGIPNGSPILSNAVSPAELTNESVRSVYFEVTVSDLQGAGDIDSVWCDVYLPYAVVPFYRLWLTDQGEDGDSTAGDGRFAVRQDLGLSFQSSGEYTLRFQAKDRTGHKSRPIIGTVTVIRENEPPALYNLLAPNSVSRNEIEPIRLTVQVSDPQGLGDIRRVYFNSYKPDGSPAQGNPFLMYDDGENGDDPIAGDGKYSLAILITSQNTVGVYRFDFYAEDLAGLVSDMISHELEVTE